MHPDQHPSMQPFQIKINQSRAIDCSLYVAGNADKIIIIAPATGVLQSFYKNIAGFFRENNITTITFDYSGIGRSLHGTIKNESSCLGTWGNRDLEAVIRHATENFPGHKIILLGHSIGGQLIGLAPSSGRAAKIILIGAQSGYWKYWKGLSRIRMWAYWFLLVPVLTKLFGYFPSKKFSRMENIPKNAAQQWAKWCRSREYLFADIPRTNLYFDKTACELTAIRMSDDFFAPKEAVEWLTAKYSNARIKDIYLSPASFNVLTIGHFSLFTEKFRDSIWDLLLKEINN